LQESPHPSAADGVVSVPYSRGRTEDRVRTWQLFLILFVLAVIALWLMSRRDNRGDRGDQNRPPKTPKTPDDRL
jgi:hypothetical protein